MDWVITTGGPPILLGRSVLKFWNGVGPDYERACEVTDYLGILRIGRAEGLVLGDESMQTTCWRTQRHGIVLIRCFCARDEASIVEWLPKLEDVSLGSGTLVLDFGEKRLRLFDSSASGSDSGSDMCGHLDIEVETTRVAVSADCWQPDGETCLIVHKLLAMP